MHRRASAPPRRGLRWGVEPVCRVLSEHGLQIAPATYYKTRPPLTRSLRDEQLKRLIEKVHAANYGVYAVRKMHAALRREGPGRPADARAGPGGRAAW